jgi:WD40 repeat protein
VYNNVVWIDENTIMYPVGHHLIAYNIEKKSQKIIQIQLDNEQIGCISINYIEQFVAVGTKQAYTPPDRKEEVHEKKASIHIFDLHSFKRKRIFKSTDGAGTKEFLSIVYSNDGKAIIAQGVAPEYNLFIWSIEKGKLLHSAKSTSGTCAIRSMSSCPFESLLTHICLSGENLFRNFRFQEGILKLTHQIKLDLNITSHTWINENTIGCGTSDGKILIFENGEIVLDIQYESQTQQDNEDKIPPLVAITAMTSFTSGLLVGTSLGRVIYFEKTNDNMYLKLKSDVFFEAGSITSINVSIKGDRAILGMSSSQIYMVQFENNAEGEYMKCERLAQSFHSGEISGMDACVSKPLLVTCGIDKTIKVWNYVENNLEVSKIFEEAATSISIHPNGLYLAATFDTNIKLMTILMDDIHTFWVKNNRNSKSVTFSNGGQYFAVVGTINVTIYNTWTCGVVETLKMGTSRVKCIEWSEFDEILISYCTDGSVQKWNSFNWGKDDEFHTASQIESSSIVGNGAVSYITTKSGVIRELKGGVVSRELSTNVPLTKCNA